MNDLNIHEEGDQNYFLVSPYISLTRENFKKNLVGYH